MQAKRFIAADMRRALEMVKQEFGEDAMILSTERTKKGVELVATTEAPIEPSLQNSQTQTPPTPAVTVPSPAPVSTVKRSEELPSQGSVFGLASGKTKEQLAEEMDMANRRMLAARKAESLTLEQWAEQETSKSNGPDTSRPILSEVPATRPIERAGVETDRERVRNEQEIRELQNEIANMRSTIEVQLAQMAETQERQFQEAQYREEQYREEQYREEQYREEQHRNESHQQNETEVTKKTQVSRDIRQRFDALGLTRQCHDQLMGSLKSLKEENPSQQKIWTKLLTSLAQRIPSDVSDPIAQGGIYAFLGTTGVGKTTTIAKLAARYVMEHGADKVVLLTTDNYRIASHNQLRTLGKILNIKVRVVEDLTHLPSMVDEYRDVPLVLIDTPGMSVSDPLLKPHLQSLKRCRGVQNLLVLSASSQYQMMKASLHSYRIAGLEYCVMTKLDECASLGDAMSVLGDHQLPLAYITDGQSVPDDIDVLKPAQLVSRAVTMSKQQNISRQQVPL